MTREIKFRCWDSVNNQMIGSAISFNTDTKLTDKFIGYTDYLKKDFVKSKNFPKPPHLVFMQYTGLKDKNGVEIYEGDILSDGAVVEWFNLLVWDGGGSDHSGFYCKKWAQYYDERDAAIDMSYHSGFDDCEVIGNIYENPNLIKKEQ